MPNLLKRSFFPCTAFARPVCILCVHPVFLYCWIVLSHVNPAYFTFPHRGIGFQVASVSTKAQVIMWRTLERSHMCVSTNGTVCKGVWHIHPVLLVHREYIIYLFWRQRMLSLIFIGRFMDIILYNFVQWKMQHHRYWLNQAFLDGQLNQVMAYFFRVSLSV